MSTAKEYKIVLAGAFGSGRTTFASRVLSASKNKKTIKAIKTENCPVELYTSAGKVVLSLFDTTLHAKGGIPDDAFFRTADAGILFFDLTSEDSYNKAEEWYDALIKANGRKGSEPLPVIVVGTKADDIKNRDMKPKDIEFPRKKELQYREVSAKANYGVKETYAEICRLLLGDGVQLTDEVEFAKPDAEVDEAKLEAFRKEYEEASK